MIDHGIRTGRLQQEASDPDVGLILLDVVLGFGAHEDPAAELAPAISGAVRPNLEIVTIVVGTDADPQGLESQIERLETAGAIVRREVREAVSYALRRAGGLGGEPQGDAEAAPQRAVRQRGAPGRTERAAEPRQPEQRHEARPVPLSALEPRPAAINIGLERFAEGVAAQGAEVVHVDWRPPAGGDARLGEILEKLRR